MTISNNCPTTRSKECGICTRQVHSSCMPQWFAILVRLLKQILCFINMDRGKVLLVKRYHQGIHNSYTSGCVLDSPMLNTCSVNVSLLAYSCLPCALQLECECTSLMTMMDVLFPLTLDPTICGSTVTCT